METILKQVIAFADQAHGDQVRKYADERYIKHPIRVMKTCRRFGYSLPVLAAAILHDVLEDTAVQPEELDRFLLTVMDKADGYHTFKLTEELTDVYSKDNYPMMNRRKRKENEIMRLEKVSAEAQTIKYADIIDNAKDIAKNDAEFAPVFLRESRTLLGKMKKGNRELHQKAIEIVEKEMNKLKRLDLHS